MDSANLSHCTTGDGGVGFLTDGGGGNELSIDGPQMHVCFSTSNNVTLMQEED